MTISIPSARLSTRQHEIRDCADAAIRRLDKAQAYFDEILDWLQGFLDVTADGDTAKLLADLIRRMTERRSRWAASGVNMDLDALPC